MTSTNREASCAERLPDHLAGRLNHVRALLDASDVHDAQGVRDVATKHHETLSGLDVLPSDDYSDEDGYTDRTAEDFSERARESLYEFPLGLSAYRVFRVELSTGGPADYLEVFCSGNVPNYEPAGEGEHYEVERIVYHFADWFDHAERALEGDDFDTAERFVSQVIPELIG